MTDRLQQIFTRQAEYLRTLKPIYQANGFSQKCYFPYAINSREAQEEFRLLAWRITEEVFEALQEWDKGAERDTDKYREEVSDVMHFLVELAICCGITTTEFATGENAALLSDEDYLELSFRRVQMYPNRMEAREAWGAFLTTLAHMMMEFRQRPWRTDDRPSDFERIKFHMGVTWFAFCAACVATGVQAPTLYSHYFAKSDINEERRNANMPRRADPTEIDEASTSVDYDNDCAP